MTELKHADVIVHMAQNGFESVERFIRLNEWADAESECNPCTYPEYEWRIKPATITYEATVPEPMRVMPKCGGAYWYVDCSSVVCAINTETNFDGQLFTLGNMFDTEAKAQAAFDALFSPLRAVK